MQRCFHLSVVVLALMPWACGCAPHPVEPSVPNQSQQFDPQFSQSLEKEVDILFVVDNSPSMALEQSSLATNFPRLIEALRSSELGPDGSGKPCTQGDERGCKLPSVHLGVVSTAVGVGGEGVPTCAATDDDGRLLYDRHGSCPGPAQPYITYADGVTNVREATTSDGVEQVKQAFSCIAQLGEQGCAYEQPLEAARRALAADNLNNRGFLRERALLAIVFINDEDDCSARNQLLFQDQNYGPASQFGPAAFRCFEFGVRCDKNGRTDFGPRLNCRPIEASDGAHPFLFGVAEYVNAFKQLKGEGRVLVSTIAGPTDNVVVTQTPDGPALGKSCQTSGSADAIPALRMKALTDAFGALGSFHSLCDPDFGPAMQQIGAQIRGRLGAQCLRRPLTNDLGTPVCEQGQVLGHDGAGRPVICAASTLPQAACTVKLVTTGLEHGPPRSTPVEPCAPDRFGSGTNSDCGATCPCYRIRLPGAECQPERDGSPFAIEVLRKSEPTPNESLHVSCASSPHDWGSEGLLEKYANATE